MKRRNQALLFLLLVTVMGVFSLFGKASVTASAEAATEMQTEVPDETTADTDAVTYQGLDEMPGIFKYMIFSLIGVVVLGIIAGIYCAVKPPRIRK